MKRILVLVGTIFMLILFGCKGLSIREPDCVGSMISDKDYDLQIVANRSYIKDKVSFARSLYEKCKENTFHSTMFSYDITGYPRKLTMDIYLWEKDVEKDELFMEIEFCPRIEEKGCNIKDDLENYVLFIDGKKIE